MKNYKKIIILGMITSMPLYAGHLTINNHTNEIFSVECGHHGEQGRSNQIQPGKGEIIHVLGDHHGKAQCVALDHHGQQLATSSFDYHHDEKSYIWEVNQNHHDY